MVAHIFFLGIQKKITLRPGLWHLATSSSNQSFKNSIMQTKFTLKKRIGFHWLTPFFFIFFSLISAGVYAQPATIYQTTKLYTWMRL